MKNTIIFTLIFLILSSLASATYIDGFNQMRNRGDLKLNATTNMTLLMNDTSAIYIDKNGLVGIGITTPTQTLTVSGDLNVSGTSFLGDVIINANNITVNDIVSRDGNISFFNETWGEKMRITYDGKVGIGETAPAEQLYVSGNGSFTSSLFLGGDLVATGIAGGAGATSDGWDDDGSIIRLISASDLVGIGTASPKYKLEVYDSTADGKSLNVSNVLYVNGSSGNVGIGTATPGYLLEVKKGTENAVNLSGVLYVNDTSGRVEISGARAISA
jgi:hypothetical protein